MVSIFSLLAIFLSLSSSPYTTPNPSPSSPPIPPMTPPIPLLPPPRPPWYIPLTPASGPRPPPSSPPIPPRTPPLPLLPLLRPPWHIPLTPASGPLPPSSSPPIPPKTPPLPLLPPPRPRWHIPFTPASGPLPPPSLPPATPIRALPILRVPAPAESGWDQQTDTIIDALIGSGDFGNWIDLIMAAGSGGGSGALPINATLFVPDDVALPEPKIPDLKPNSLLIDPFLIAYHIVPQRLSFADLLSCAAGSRLPTLLPGNSLLITNNSVSNYTVNDSPITHPDLYLSDAVSVQGVGAAFDYNRYGNEGGGGSRYCWSPPRLVHQPPSHAPENDSDLSFLPGEIAGGGRSYPDFFLCGLSVLVFGFSIIKTFLALIIH